jgi:hypothetical protein
MFHAHPPQALGGGLQLPWRRRIRLRRRLLGAMAASVYGYVVIAR